MELEKNWRWVEYFKEGGENEEEIEEDLDKIEIENIPRHSKTDRNKKHLEESCDKGEEEFIYYKNKDERGTLHQQRKTRNTNSKESKT